MQAKGRDKDEELALFFEMRRREKENEGNNNNFPISEELDDLPFDSSNNESSPISKSVSYLPLQRKSRDEFLNSENEKSDYDWLLTPPGTPLLSLEMELQKTAPSQLEVPPSRPIALRSRPSNIQVEPASKRNIASKNPSVPSELKVSNTGNRRPLSAEGPKPAMRRSATPTARPTLPSTTKPARSSTPSSRPSIAPTKSVAPPARSSTPTRSSARSSTPTGRPSLPAPKAARSATPTSGRASSTSKLRPTSSKATVLSHGPSPTVISRPTKLDTSSNLITSVPARPASASRARPAAPSVVKSSCSPSRVRAPHSGVINVGNLNRYLSRSRCSDSDEVSPVVMGNRMVERVVNMRKLAPPKREDDSSANGNSAGKSFSTDTLGFGRSLSKKSLDMAIRHMDIRRSVQSGNLRPLVTSVPASSVYSIRSGTTKNPTTYNSDSPHATSSNADSEPSVNNASVCLDGSDIEGNGIGSEQQI